MDSAPDSKLSGLRTEVIMSSIVRCEKCGGYKEVPSFEGDGVYSTHYCKENEQDNQQTKKSKDSSDDEE